MRGLWFVFLAACSFSPTPGANSTPADSGAITAPDGSTNGSGSGTLPPADAQQYGPGSGEGSGSDCMIGHGPLIRGGSGCCGPRCGR
ncbi:MAG TPA: hypothetical protein VGG28_21295 [Kofleriaceae bacterium]